MNFFIPRIDDPAMAEHTYQAIRAYVAQRGHASTERRVYSLSFSHNGAPYVSTVGVIEPSNAETVVAILEAAGPRSSFMICTLTHGVISGEPAIVDGAIAAATDFEPG